ncbi:putative uncharacterized protein DDB_G0283051 [Drosophila montana]|uniref:putative uncharacterized protein DDB_G0283051 n=1 Tax=Drosophila montana TaxID=40370 RepID=UPI00313DD1C3
MILKSSIHADDLSPYSGGVRCRLNNHSSSDDDNSCSNDDNSCSNNNNSSSNNNNSSSNDDNSSSNNNNSSSNDDYSCSNDDHSSSNDDNSCSHNDYCCSNDDNSCSNDDNSSYNDDSCSHNSCTHSEVETLLERKQLVQLGCSPATSAKENEMQKILWPSEMFLLLTCKTTCKFDEYMNIKKRRTILLNFSHVSTKITTRGL